MKADELNERARQFAEQAKAGAVPFAVGMERLSSALSKEPARLIRFNEENENGSVFLPGSLTLPPHA